jgi:heat shock protein HslJ
VLKRTLLVTLLGLALSACAGDGLTGPSDLAGGAWRLVDMEPAGAARFVPSDPSRFTLEFEAPGRLGVRADCNVCGGGFTLAGDTLHVTEMACTLVFCAGPGGSEFAGLVQGRSSVELQDGTLRIESQRGRLTLRR